MMNEKQRVRVERYLDSSGIAKGWYYLVVLVTMGDVSDAVEEYYYYTSLEQQAREYANRVNNFAEEERTREGVDPLSFERNPGMCVPPSQRKKERLRYDDNYYEEEDTSSIDAMNAAILTSQLSNDDTPVYNEAEGEAGWSGFGGGGDLAGGGAGGDWSPSNDVASNTSPSMLSDSY
jgi:hypothetical protein